MSHDDDLVRFLAGELPDDEEAALLPPVGLPPGLEELVLLRLEAEGLVAPPDALTLAAVPPGLLGATLSRLEAEGLVARAAPTPPARWRAVAALLLAAALGAAVSAAAAAAARAPTPVVPVPAPRVVPTLIADPGARATLAAETARRVAAEAALDALPAALDAARERGRVDAARDAAPAREDLTRALEETREQVVALERDLTLARATAEVARARASALATALDDAREQVGPRGLRVDAADDVLRWDPAGGAWAAVEPDAALPPGTLVRGDGLTSALVVSGLRLELRDTTFVVVDARRIEPLPDASRRGAAARSAPELRTLVPALIAEFASGSAGARAEAQRALTALYRRHPDPGPGVVRRLADARLGRSEEAGPPVTAEGWEAWWRRVRPTL